MENKNRSLKKESSLIMYTSADGITKIEVTLTDETVWLTTDQMAELFGRDRSTIGKHIRNIFKEGELLKSSVWANFAHTAEDGKIYNVDYYNLDMIISVGYRVNSLRGTQFRIWATQILNEYIRKGFALDDEQLKRLGGGNYYEELLRRIRDIRSSEKVFWRKILDIYATSIDYNPKAESSATFFKQVQNKMHWLETIDDYLKMTRREILKTSGKVSHSQAIERAHEEYQKYQKKLEIELTPVEKDFLLSIEELEKIESNSNGGM